METQNQREAAPRLVAESSVKSRGVAKRRKGTLHFASISRGFSIIMQDAGDMRNA